MFITFDEQKSCADESPLMGAEVSAEENQNQGVTGDLLRLKALKDKGEISEEIFDQRVFLSDCTNLVLDEHLGL